MRIILLVILSLVFVSGCGSQAQSQSVDSKSPKADEGSNAKQTASDETSKDDTSEKQDDKGKDKQDDKSQSADKDKAKSADAGDEKGEKKDSHSAANPKFITFEDLLINIKEQTQYRPFMMKPEVQALDGVYVSVPGVMLSGSKTKGIKEFVLLRNKECKFGPDGQADHVIRVLMTEGNSAKFTTDKVDVAGQLKIIPYNGPAGYTWSIFELHADKVGRLSRSRRQ